MRHTITPVLSILSEIPENEKIAVVGLPCHMKALSNLKKRKLLKLFILNILNLLMDFGKPLPSHLISTEGSMESMPGMGCYATSLRNLAQIILWKL